MAGYLFDNLAKDVGRFGTDLLRPAELLVCVVERRLGYLAAILHNVTPVQPAVVEQNLNEQRQRDKKKQRKRRERERERERERDCCCC